MAQVVAFVSIEMSKKREEGRFSRLGTLLLGVLRRASIYVCARYAHDCYARFRHYFRRQGDSERKRILGQGCQRLSVRRELKFLLAGNFSREQTQLIRRPTSCPVGADKTTRGVGV